jgi:hypothetical protein
MAEKDMRYDADQFSVLDQRAENTVTRARRLWIETQFHSAARRW